MFIVSLLAIILIAAWVAYKSDKEISDTLPMTVGGVICVMYMLAFKGLLKGIDYISLVVILCLLVGKNRKEILKKVFTVQNACILAVGVLLFVSQIDRIALWWDDLNFWSTDAKALFFLNGFPDKYGNVAPEFGDYPPAISLFKYLFLHGFSEYKEGIGFGAYVVLNYMLLTPLISRLKLKNRLASLSANILAGIVLILLPTVANIICFEGTCADVTMGIIYGNLLFAITDFAEDKKLFYFTRIAILGSVLVLCKSVGIEWAAFAFLFFIIINRQSMKGQIRYVVLTFMTWAGTWFSWLLFCLVNRRVAKLTSNGVRIAMSGNTNIGYYAKEKAAVFLEGFSVHPMHTHHTWGLDLSALTMLCVFAVVIILFYKLKITNKFETKKITIFTIFTALVSYGFIFIGHVTIFAGETQYESGQVMAISISRYAAPFVIGTMMLLWLIVNKKSDNVKKYMWLFMFVIITCDFWGTYEGIWGYRGHKDTDYMERCGMIKVSAREFVELTYKNDNLYGKRVLYLSKDNLSHWVNNTYLNYEVAPVAVVYGDYYDGISDEELRKTINDSHAHYVYFEDTKELVEIKKE